MIPKNNKNKIEKKMINVPGGELKLITLLMGV